MVAAILFPNHRVILSLLGFNWGISMPTTLPIGTDIFSDSIRRLGAMAVALVLTGFGSNVTLAQGLPDIIPPVSGAEVSIEGLKPADVLARVRVIQDELEQLRFEIGKPEFSKKGISVKSAQPRQVLFQATSMFVKTGKLFYELSGLRPPPLRSRIAKDVRPGQVWMAANDTYRLLLVIRAGLQLPEAPMEKVQDPKTTPADVLEAVVATNRMLNGLLNSGPSSHDVLERVLVAETAVEQLLQGIPGSAIRSPVVRQRGRRPADVYATLRDSYDVLTRVATHYDFETLDMNASELKLGKAEEAGVTPSRVFDLATLISSELVYLHAEQDGSILPKVEISNYVLPSHVHQHAETLRLNLIELESQLKKSKE